MGATSRFRTATRSPDAWAWLAMAASVPLLAVCITRLSSGFDYWPALALARHVRYGSSIMFAYPLPVYLPFAPLGLTADPWPQLVAPVICLGFLGAGLWLWGGRRIPVLLAAVLTPVGVGVLVNSNFNSAVAVFGLGLAIWAKQNRRYALVGVGAALSLWRPANCLPVLAVLLMSGWTRRGLGEAVGAGTVLLAPLTALAFLIQPDWMSGYLQRLPAYEGWAGLGPRLLYGGGPLVYAAAEVAVTVAGIWVMRRRGVAEGAAVALALTVLLATVGGAYSGAMALPALVLAATDPRYARLPAIAGLIGWIQVTVLLAIEFPVGVVAYWFVLQAYPLIRRAPAAERPLSGDSVDDPSGHPEVSPPPVALAAGARRAGWPPLDVR